MPDTLNDTIEPADAIDAATVRIEAERDGDVFPTPRKTRCPKCNGYGEALYYTAGGTERIGTCPTCHGTGRR